MWLTLISGCTPLAPIINHAGKDEASTSPVTLPEVETHVHADWTNVHGRTEEGLAYLGNPNAAVTLIDYSDFL